MIEIIGKITKSNKSSGGYIWLELTPDEMYETLEKARKFNADEFVKCHKEACTIAERIGAKESFMVEKIALALFEKQAIQNFTVLSDALDKKNFDHKNEPIGYPVKTIPTQSQMKSAIDESFEKVLDPCEFTCQNCHVSYKSEEALKSHKCPVGF